MVNSINGYTLWAIKEICEKATPAPWVLLTSDSGCPEYIGANK